MIESMSGDDLVKVLLACGGDIQAFAESFKGEKKEAVICRALTVLERKENTIHLSKWNELIERFRTVKLLLLQREAIANLENMPKPAGDKQADWIKYADFWTNLKVNQQAADSPASAALEAVQRMIDRMEAFEKEQEPDNDEPRS